MRPTQVISIDELIKLLTKEKERGSTKVSLEGRGTLVVNGLVLMTTESQM